MKKILLILTTILLLFSCGKKEQNENLTKVTFVLDWTPNTNHTGIYVAKDKGFFKENGLLVDIVQPSEDSSSAIVGTNRAEFGVYFQPNMLSKLKRGMPIKAIAAITSHNTAGLLLLKNEKVKSPKDLINLRYASWEDKIDDATVKDLVGNDLNIVPFGEITDPIKAMKLNILDYVIAYYAWDGINAELQGVETDFFMFKDYNQNLDYYTPVIITNETFAKEHEDIVKKFLAAAKKGYLYSSKNPEKAAKILMKYAKEANPKLIMASQKWISQYYLDENGNWGEFDIDRWDRFYNWLYENKLIDKKLESSYGVTNEYIK